MVRTRSRSWWRGTWLVAERGILGPGSPTYTLATVGRAPAALVTAVDVAAPQEDYRVRYVTRDDEAAVRDAVREGDAVVGLAGDIEYVASKDAGTFPAVVSQAVVTLRG